MKISLHWLQDFVRFRDDSAHAIAERLTASVAEVERVEELEDTIFHIDNHAITHRPDLFSHIGFARECVAIGLAKWKKRPTLAGRSLGEGWSQPIIFSHSPLPFHITVKDKNIVPRYCAVTVAIADTGTTPLWMRCRLEAVGYRPVSLPVDITNYVAAELGMPLHSFDVADIHGDIAIRAAGKGERIVTLDGCERALPDGAIVMSDDSGIFDLLGIMGGLRSSTKETTRNILLHAALADPATIRRTIIATGLRTEAATIYEKGIPPVMAERGILRALDLFLDLVPGARSTSRLLLWGNDGSARRIPLSLDRASRTIGMDIAKKKAVCIFENLGCTVKTPKSDRLVVTPPPHRPDLRAEHDLIEELARVHGYDRLPAKMPSAPCLPPPRDHSLQRMRAQAKEEGFLEILPLSLVGPKLLRRCGCTGDGYIRVENNLGEDLSLLQPSALPRLLEHAEKTFRMTGSPLRTFAIARVFSSPQEEIPVIALLLAHKNTPSLRSSPALLLKSHLAAILRSAGFSLTCRPHSAPPLQAHPEQCAEIVCRDRAVGELFTLHPDICANFDLPASAAASVNLSALFAIAPDAKAFRPLPIYPGISYDITLSRKHSSIHLQYMLKRARSASSILSDLHVTDLFDGKPLSKGDYNVTLRCLYQDPTKTLTEEEAKKEHEKVTRALSSI